MTPDLTPKQRRLHAHQRHVTRLDRQIAAYTRLSNRAAWVRLGVFLGGAVACTAVFATAGMWPGVIGLVIWLAAFGAAVRHHNRLKAGIARFNGWRAIKRQHIARMELDWDALPAPLDLPGGALALDLDLTGAQSLHRLVDTCAAHEGSRRVLDWLSASSPDPDRIREHQALVRELTTLVTFRDRLRLSATLPGGSAGRQWDGRRVRRWLEALPPVVSLGRRALGLTVLGVLDAVLFGLYAAHVLPPVWGFTFMLYAAIYLMSVQQLGDPFAAALALTDPLHDLRAVFTHLESYRYGDQPHLRRVCEPFLDSANRPSAEITRLGRVTAAASLRGNPLLWSLVCAVVPWDIYVAILLDRRRRSLADRLPQWLEVWFEVEALCALAALAYLNPDYCFPEMMAETAGAPVLEASALGHPLIPDQERVCNDFALAQLGSVALITGSNMSGKSTFLRTVGLNLCLAYAGGPVNARAVRLIPFRLFTCIRVTDSVTNGISYFYAEVKRLKALLDALEADDPLPLFFLIDEIFRGTNNRERLIGSRAYIRALAGKHGGGLISTHDLELIKLADEMPAIRNYHFAETVGDGRLLFDYTLRDGPSPSTNALVIMDMEGLPVE